MLSLTETVQAFQDRSLNNAIDAKAKRLVNGYIHQILSTTGLPFNYGYSDFEAVNGEETYTLRADCNKLVSVSFKNAGLMRNIKILNTRREYDTYRVTNMTSNFPYVCYYDSKDLHVYPTPQQSITTIIYITYEKRVPDLTFADTTITSVTSTLESNIVTGSGFQTAWEGKYFRTTDGIWYQIDVVTSPTQMVLTTPYNGATTTASATIAVLIPLPDGYELTPVYLALADYFMADEGKLTTTDRWRAEGEKMVLALREQFSNPSDTIAGSADDITQNIPGFFVYR
jgi:hypothetical protein